MNPDIVDTQSGSAVDEDIGGAADRGPDARMRTARAAMGILLNLRLVAEPALPRHLSQATTALGGVL